MNSFVIEATQREDLFFKNNKHRGSPLRQKNFSF